MFLTLNPATQLSTNEGPGWHTTAMQLWHTCAKMTAVKLWEGTQCKGT